MSATTELVSETRPSPTAGALCFSTAILFGRADQPRKGALVQDIDVTSKFPGVLQIPHKVPEVLVLKYLTQLLDL